MSRIPLLAPADVPEAHRAFAEGFAQRGALINLYRAMLHAPEPLRRFYDLLALLWSGAIDARTREIAILSTVAASDAPYPLGWHILDGAEAGLADAEIRALVSGAHDALVPRDAAVADFARQLTLDAQVAAPTYDAVAAFLDERQIVELTMIAGLYRMVACIANALDVELDDEASRALSLLAE